MQTNADLLAAKDPGPAFEGTGKGGGSGQAGDRRSWPWTADQNNYLASRVAPPPSIRAAIDFLCQFVIPMRLSAIAQVGSASRDLKPPPRSCC
jgi:hypothetical protein